MKNKILHILRHGETDYNKNGLVQGRGINASLNETGVGQARRVYEHFRERPLDHIYTSTLVRTHETTQYFPSSIGRTALEGLDEISWGDQEGVKASPEARNMYKNTVLAWQRGELERNVGGGETPIEVADRQKKAMDVILNDDNLLILICMHGRAIRILLSWLLNYPLRYMDGFPHQNCAYYTLGWNGHSFQLIDFNKTDHL